MHSSRRRRDRMHHAEDDMYHPTKHVDYTASWNRPPPAGLPNLSFEPTFLTPQVRNSLSKGFPASPPPTDLLPHPFVTHNVTELDWQNFVDHIAEGAKLTKKEREIARRNIPILNIVPIVGQALQYGTEAYLRSKKPASAANVVDSWNHHFFHPRKLQVALYKGPECISHAHVLSGSTPLPSDSHVAPTSPPASSSSSRPEKSQFGDFQSSQSSGPNRTSIIGTSSGSGKGSSIMKMTSNSSGSGKGKEKDEQFKLYLAPFNAVTTPQ
ncbi:hypothetical protein DL96DRAFT_1623226 [Flagelloscypha sp. PMI_526]|nr:hypothetical protein DL96DRAFT_1623226 [Flagelloscypha sp. PMI_526]